MASGPKRKSGKQSEATNDSESVKRYLEALDHPLKPEVQALRKIILKADARITEGIKWNAPSFHHGDWFATFDLRSHDWVQIIFHRGAKVKTVGDSRFVKDPEAILKWITNDRCLVRFVSSGEVAARSSALSKIVAEWVQNLSDDAIQGLA
jgi:hypothetical protein